MEADSAHGRARKIREAELEQLVKLAREWRVIDTATVGTGGVHIQIGTLQECLSPTEAMVFLRRALFCSVWHASEVNRVSRY